MTRHPSHADNLRNDLERRAAAECESGHYKDAIALYKQLLQHEENTAWIAKLAYCYLQQAKVLAARGFYDAALGLWKDHAELVQLSGRDVDHYLLWLLLNEEVDEAKFVLETLDGNRLEHDHPQLCGVLGLLMLTSYPELISSISGIAPVAKHYRLVREALDTADMDACRKALSSLPYRSAFRDLRILAEALSTSSRHPQEACKMLERISGHSPYAGAAVLLEAAQNRGHRLAESLTGLNSTARETLAELLHLSSEQTRLIERMTEHSFPPTGKRQFALIMEFPSLFDGEAARRHCLVLLADLPSAGKDYRRRFGEIDEFELNRIQALKLESRHLYRDAAKHWQNCIDRLADEHGENALKIALIQRHLADHESDGERATQLRIESLEHDPGDKDSMLAVLRYFGDDRAMTNDYSEWLERAEAQFPDDAEILTLALEEAVRGPSYQKAVRCAKRLLASDPLNGFARRTLISAHLNQARKLLKKRAIDRANEEIDKAETLPCDARQKRQNRLLRGLSLVAAGDETAGLAAFAENLSLLHDDPLNRQFHAIVEARLCALPEDMLLQGLPPADDHCPTAEEISRLLRQMDEFGANRGRRPILRAALQRLDKPLRLAIERLADGDETLPDLCRTLENLSHFELLGYCADCADRMHRRPLWSYYRVCAETRGNAAGCDFIQLQRLQQALEQARTNDDRRASVLIERYLERHRAEQPSGEVDRLARMVSTIPDEDPALRLFAHLPEKILHDIETRTDKLLHKLSPERLADEFAGPTANAGDLLSAMMRDPALFKTLAMLKAAAELKVDAGIGIDDVLTAFNVKKKRFRLFPF